MKYQTTFQQAEQPSQTHLSCGTYIGDSVGSYPKHCHSYYELSYIFHGQRYETINSTRYEVGDHSLFFIPPLAIHNINNHTEVEDLVIQFSHQFLRNSSVLFDKHSILKVHNNEEGYFQLDSSHNLCFILEQIKHFTLLKNATQTNANSSFQEKFRLDLKINSLCLDLISTLLADEMIEIDSDGANYSEIISLDPLINELLANPGKTINMQKASHMAGMSYSHFSRIFEKITGFHYTEFCNLLRIRQAEELLLTTSLPIAEVAAAIGIDTLSYFTRLFKKMNGSSPSSYRKLYQ